MKTKIIILITLVLSVGLCLSTPNSMADDTQIEQKRERLWNLLQEQKPDSSYVDESQDLEVMPIEDLSSEPMVNDDFQMESVDEVVEKVVGGVVESMESVFDEQPVADESDMPQSDLAPKIDAIVNYTEVDGNLSNLIDLQNEFISTSMANEMVNVDMHWSDNLSQKTIIEPDLLVKQEVPEMIEPSMDVMTDEVMLEPIQDVSDSMMDMAYDMGEAVDTAADAVADEMVVDMDEHETDYRDALETQDIEAYGQQVEEVIYDNVEPVQEKKGFWKKLKSSFKSDEPSRNELNEQFMEEDIQAVDIDIDSADNNYGVVMEGEEPSDAAEPGLSEYEQMRKILGDKVELELDGNHTNHMQADAMVEEVQMIHHQDAENWDQLAAAVNVVKEPDSYTYKPVEDAKFTYEEPVYEEVTIEHSHDHGEAGVEAYVDGEWVDVNHGHADTHQHAEMYVDDGVEEEGFWKKVERKMSMSGMTKEEVQELDYWEVPVQEQTVEDIADNLRIDAAFEEAASVKLESQEPLRHKFEQPTRKISSPREIIRAAIPEEYRDRKVDLDFDNTNLADILLIVADTGGMNIVLDPALKSNTLDLHLKQISLEEALLLIANSYDLGFKLVGDAIFVTENDKLRFENKVSRIIKVRNIAVEEAKMLVGDLVDKVSSSEELNSLIVLGDPSDVAKVEQIIKNIDTPQPQVVLVAKVIEVNKDALKDLGVDWSDQITVGYQESGRPADLEDVEDSSSSFYRIAQLQRNPLNFETTIRMLEQQNKAKVLSEPRVTTLNGKTAEIFVGDEVPYTITNITGGVVTNDVRFVEPGIRLTITPSIIEDDFVVMKVEPEVSFIVSFRGPNDEFPQVRTREATAHVRVENNQPFVLGGILNQEDKQSLFKVPFLGKLPLFGNLFSYERNTAIDTELIITVIPTIVHGKN